jgi:hypothetical protein
VARLRGKPVTLSNGREWPSRDAAIEHFRSLRDRYPIEKSIDDPIDHDDLCALLERFDATFSTGPSKIGCGISHFVTRENFANGGRTIGFWVVRIDQTETDFSFIKAVTLLPTNPDSEFVDACRDSVREQISDAKDAEFATSSEADVRLPCEITGEPLTNFAARLDYAPSEFRDIVWAFRVAEGWETAIPPGIVTKPADAQTTTTFVDIDAMVRFRQFHARHAQLRLIAKSIGRSRVLATKSAPIKRPIRLR